MTITRCAVVMNGTVTNVVLCDAESGWTPDGGVLVTLSDDSPVSSGWLLRGDEWVAPVRPPKTFTWDEVRSTRDLFLSRCDWTQVADAPVDAAAWAVYRQQLRDLPQSFDDPADVEWPIPPA